MGVSSHWPVRYREDEGGSADALALPVSLPGQSSIISLFPEPSHYISRRARGHLWLKLKGQKRMKCTSSGSSCCRKTYSVRRHVFVLYIKKASTPKMAGSIHSLPMLHHSLLFSKAINTLGNTVFRDPGIYGPTLPLSSPEHCSPSLPLARVSPGRLSKSDIVAYLWGKCRGAGYGPERNCRELCSFTGPEYYAPGRVPSKVNTTMENGKERRPR